MSLETQFQFTHNLTSVRLCQAVRSQTSAKVLASGWVSDNTLPFGLRLHSPPPKLDITFPNDAILEAACGFIGAWLWPHSAQETFCKSAISIVDNCYLPFTESGIALTCHCVAAKYIFQSVDFGTSFLFLEKYFV